MEQTESLSCPNSEALMINDTYCHETGCPTNHLHSVRECVWCGQPFEPLHRYQTCCDSDCEQAYYS